MYEYRATVIRVVDGDTVWLSVDLGFDVHRNDSFRLAGINAPETSTSEGKVAKDWLISLLAPGTAVTVHTVKDHREKYGRYLATLLLADENLNDLAVKSGHAVPYSGGPRTP